MRRTVLVLTLGLAGGMTAYQGWFYTHRPAPADSLETQLAWMQSDLDLAPDQFASIKAVHEQFGPRLMQLAKELDSLRAEFAAFERERVTAGEVDFLEVARAAAARRTIDRECDQSRRELVARSVEVMTPEQRKRYLDILAPALRDADASTIY